MVDHGKRIATVMRRYKYCNFFDCSRLEESPRELLTFVDRLALGNTFPVLVMSWSDLLDTTESVMFLLRYFFLKFP